jgi:hypothetical protein
MTPRAFSVPMESERGSSLSFDAFSSREPVPTSLENALAGEIFARDDRDTVEIEQMRAPAFVRQRGAPARLQQ